MRAISGRLAKSTLTDECFMCCQKMCRSVSGKNEGKEDEEGKVGRQAGRANEVEK